MIYDLQKTYKEKVIPEMMKKFGYKNKLAVPRIEKVVVNTGIGSIKDEAQKELIEKHFSLIVGQKPSKRVAKKSIASFKIREGSHVGHSATLRGERMYDFLTKMIFVAIPRKRDFRGLKVRSADGAGNLTIGFKEHLVFPEMADEDTKNIFGLEVTIVTSAGNKEEAVELFKLLGFPWQKSLS